MKHSYIVCENTLIARIPARSSGEIVKFSYATAAEAIDASRENNLVNARNGKISNAKKWDAVYCANEDSALIKEINPGEFLLS